MQVHRLAGEIERQKTLSAAALLQALEDERPATEIARSEYLQAFLSCCRRSAGPFPLDRRSSPDTSLEERPMLGAAVNLREEGCR
jgi:hypothetical protein